MAHGVPGWFQDFVPPMSQPRGPPDGLFAIVLASTIMNLRSFLLLVCATFGLLGRIPAQFGIVTADYHGVTATQHQNQYTLLQGQGYRPISLAVAGGLANARYSAVWQRTGGPAWVAAHGMTYAQYQTQAGTWAGQGYRAKLVAASGVGADVVFAAMWVQDGVTVYHQQALATSSLDGAIATQRSQGRRLTSAAAYNRNGIDYHAVVFEPDASGIAWGGWGGDDGPVFSAKFDEHSLGGERPSLVSLSDSQRYTHVWRDDRIGNWVLVAGRTSSQFDGDKTLHTGQGMTLVCIGAGGSGSNARYAGLFVERISPLPRSHTRTGVASLGMVGFDNYMETLMTDHMVRNASLAVARHGRLIYARGFTYAENGQLVTQPDSAFRLGSISKPLCAAVVHDLIDQGPGGITLDTVMTSYLGIPGGPGSGNGTVRRLLRHTSGMVNVVDEIDAALWWNNSVVFLPPDESIIVRYGASQHAWTTLDRWNYSNCGNTALGQMVEQATGQQYMNVLRSRLFQPAGTNDLWQQTARPQNFAPSEVRYHLRELYLRPGNRHLDRRLQSPQYSQEWWDAAGGVVTSAVALARVVSAAFCIRDDSPTLSAAARSAAMVRGTYNELGSNDPKNWSDGSWQWTTRGNGVFAYHHNGGQDGTATRCIWTTDGLCIVALTNMTDAYPGVGALLDIADAVTIWPSHDLFPSFGMPSFSRTPWLGVPTVASVPNVGDAGFDLPGEGLEQVISVDLGSTTITSQSPSTWHDGWFEKVSPTRLRVYPPQGLVPSTYQLRARSLSGLGNAQSVSLTRATQFAAKAADAVNGAQPFAVVCSRGNVSGNAFVVLGFSLDQIPSVLPGTVSLGIGNNFTTLWTSDTRNFGVLSGAVRWDFPPLGSLPRLHLQAAALDPNLLFPMPLPVTPVETVTRTP